MSWQQQMKSWMVPTPGRAADARQPGIEAGMYHYQRSRDDGFMRFHLRVERNGESLLIAGASEAVRLSRAGTTVIKRMLDGESAEVLASELQAAGADQRRASQLVAEVAEIVAELGSPSSRFPVFNLSDPADDPRDAELIAPFQADVEVENVVQLRSILEKLWQAGIPHARFLPAAELPDDQLVQAVEWAEDLGMIAGVRATATWFSEADRPARLAAVGTDYLLFPWAVEADLHARWFGADDWGRLDALIQRVLEFEMTPVIEVPLVTASIEALDEQRSRIAQWNVAHAEVYALAKLAATEATDTGPAASPATAPGQPLDGDVLPAIAARIEEMADENALRLTWLPPVAVRSDECVDDQARRGPRAGGDVTIRVLANGDVLPPRGAATPAGNLLTNPWPDIWGCAVFRHFQSRVEANTRCEHCPGLAICAADCPADSGGWSHD